MSEITRESAKQIILGAKRIFGVTFIKKNGDERTMACRLGVTKHLKGGLSTTAHIDNLITVFNMVGKRGYRNVNTNTLTRVKVSGETYEVV